VVGEALEPGAAVLRTVHWILEALDSVLKEAVNLDMRFYNIGRRYFPLDG
jgi:hypothetical protein